MFFGSYPVQRDLKNCNWQVVSKAGSYRQLGGTPDLVSGNTLAAHDSIGPILFVRLCSLLAIGYVVNGTRKTE